MRKQFSVLLAVMLLFLMLSSCKDGGDSVVEPSEPESTVTVAGPQDVSHTSPDVLPATPSDTSGATPDTPIPTQPEPDAADNSALPPTFRDELSGLWARIDGSTATIPLTAALFDEFYLGNQAPPYHSTTPNAYLHLLNSNYDTDLIFVTYPSENEFEMAERYGVELEIIPVVKDALVFLINAENPVGNASSSELRGVYTGGISNWAELGGIYENIIPYQRTADSGSQTLFLKLLMGDVEPMKPPSEWVETGMAGLVEAVSNYDNSRSAIGYSMFYYVNNMYGNSRFKLLSVDGVRPTRETIMSGEYPLDDCYYAVMRGDTPPDSQARKLVEWLLTDEGQALAVRAGYIPLRDIEGASSSNAIDPLYLGDTENSSGTGGTVLKSGIESAQPKNGVRPPLSDLFYDGFNYIAYINDRIMAQIDWVDIEWDGVSWGESHQIRPFTGIPNDYPNYEISHMGNLWIYFPEGNPFFKWSESMLIRLTEDISPYGYGLPAGYSVTYEYGRRMLPHIDLMTLNVELHDDPDMTRRINEQLKVWTDSLPDNDDAVKLIDGFSSWYDTFHHDPDWTHRLQPSAGLWRDYLSVSYYLQSYGDFAFYSPLLFSICFDIKTGKVVNLADLLPEILDYSKSRSHTIVVFDPLNDWRPYQEDLLEGYVPVAGSVITEAWLDYSYLSMCLTEPDGRVLQVSFWGELD